MPQGLSCKRQGFLLLLLLKSHLRLIDHRIGYLAQFLRTYPWEEAYPKASAAKPSGKLPPGDKKFGLDPVIRFYEIEDGDETEKENNQKSLSFTTQALRHLSKTSSRGSFVISIRSIMKDPWLLTQCAI